VNLILVWRRHFVASSTTLTILELYRWYVCNVVIRIILTIYDCLLVSSKQK